MQYETRCKECGKQVTIALKDGADPMYTNMMIAMAKNICCEECAAIKGRADALPKESIEGRLITAGVPYGYIHDRATSALITKPIVRHVAEYLWRKRHKCIMLGGETGAGKSTSACFMVLKLLEERSDRKIRYTTMAELKREWYNAHTSKPDTSDKMLAKIFALDWLIIDEVVGKTKASEAASELLFELLEAVNCMRCRTRIWLLGNFYHGSLEYIFTDPVPAKRRLEENFSVAWIGKDAIQEHTIWSVSGANVTDPNAG